MGMYAMLVNAQIVANRLFHALNLGTRGGGILIPNIVLSNKLHLKMFEPMLLRNITTPVEA